MKGTSFVVDELEEIMNMVVNCSHPVKLFFCKRRAEFAVVIEVYGVWIAVMETSMRAQFVVINGCAVIGKFCKRQPYSLSCIVYRDSRCRGTAGVSRLLVY